MQWTSLNDLREKFLSFFESKGHLRLPSFPLVPQGDKSLLLINSGMAPMKKFFTGEEEPPRTRVCTCQKCIRTPDLERVGHTARHGTFFEMLGNFSFGDYFKNEAIPWAWEFLTSDEWLAIPKELLWPSIYEKDEEAFELWNKKIGVPAHQITRLGKADNFWEHGSGPCGPCSEIYFDRGEKYGCGSPDCRPGCDCDSFMEIWNNVFSQFNNDGKGNYTELRQKNIDTGMGLERLACVMQGVDNMFEVDSIRKLIDAVAATAGKAYGDNAENDISIRVVTDHVRSATFMISDGVVPSNEGRGYVLRRILRRACRHGKLLGIEGRFLPPLAEVAIGESENAYPALKEKHDYILKVISMEEERFNATIDGGLSILSGLVNAAKAEGKTEIRGEDAFRLYDTYGFPFDLTREMLEEEGLTVNEETFKTLMNEQRARARAARGNISGWSDSEKNLLSGIPATDFVGYTEDTCEATLLAILADNSVESTVSDGECVLIFDRTVFYGEGGGQVGDTGVLTVNGKTVAVTDTKKTEGLYLHEVTLDGVTLNTGDKVTLSIDTDRRDAIRRNHSACHLLQAALRQVLGNHVAQAGSYVDAVRVRFDFSHFAPMTKDELASVESLVNREILRSLLVDTVVTDKDSAEKAGAMALFGEKYGKSVRMVKMGDFSTELCGGTHVESTGNIGLFKIISESSVAAGVRRIEGTTGLGVLALMEEKDTLLSDTQKELKAQNVADLPKRAQAVLSEVKSLEKEIEQMNAKMANDKLQSLLQNPQSVGALRLVTARLEMKTDAVRALADAVKADYPDMVAVFATVNEGKLQFIAACGKDAVKNGAHAGNLLRAISAVAGGKGGGRPDSATAGGSDLSKIDEALALAETLLKQ